MCIAKPYIIAFISAILLYFPIQGKGQAMYFENFSTKNGLTQNTGYCIAQTPEGFMWFGTQSGLNRYDGYGMKVYKKNDADTLSLCGNFIRSLQADGKDTLWVGTTEGISIYRPTTDKFYHPSAFFNIVKDLDKLPVRKIKKDAEGNVWILSVKGGLYCFNKKSRQLQYYFQNKVAGIRLHNIVLNEQGQVCLLSDKDIYLFDGSQFMPMRLPAQIQSINHAGILQDAAFTKGELWLASSQKGIFRIKLYPEIKFIAHITNTSAHWKLTQNEIKCLLKDSKGNIWVGTTSDGIYHFDYSTGKIRNGRQDKSDPSSLHYNYTHCLYEDRQGILWVGLSYGIDKHDANKHPFENILLQQNNNAKSNVDNMILGLYLDMDSMFYVGTLVGGMTVTDKRFKTFKHFKQQEGNKHALIHNEVYDFAKDDKGNIWIATYGGLCKYNASSQSFTTYPGTPLVDNSNFYSIIKLRYENALLVGGESVLYKFDLDNHTWQSIRDTHAFVRRHTFTISYMEEDKGVLGEKGYVWLCTSGEGLLAYNYLTGNFKEFPAIKDASPIVKHMQLRDDKLWLGTDKGLVVATIGSWQKPMRYGSEKGLAGDMIYAVQAEKNGNIWVSTNHGISRWNHTLKTFTNYRVGHGKSEEFNTAVACKDSEGYLYFGSVNGIVRFKPEDIKPSGFSPRPLITQVQVMNKPLATVNNISYTQTIDLTYKQNFITFHFVAPNYLQSENTTYRYKLEGVNKDWQSAGDQNSANYTELIPGVYTFKVMAANRDGNWSKVTSIRINIVPPFWKTWWFNAIAICCLIMITYGLIRLRVQYVRRQGNLNAQMAEMEMKALHAQMNPHFIFNCLGSIKQMIQDREHSGASRYLTKFAKLIRMSLDHSQKPLITLEENNEYLIYYLLMEQLRFNDSFQYDISVAENINSKEVVFPPMMIQPLVENGIWHGLLEKEGARKLSIRYYIRKNTLVCEIEDNGKGIQKSPIDKKDHQSIGIANVNKRLSLLNRKYKLHCTLEIMDNSTRAENAQGTLAILTLPLITT